MQYRVTPKFNNGSCLLHGGYIVNITLQSHTHSKQILIIVSRNSCPAASCVTINKVWLPLCACVRLPFQLSTCVTPGISRSNTSRRGTLYTSSTIQPAPGAFLISSRPAACCSLLKTYYNIICPFLSGSPPKTSSLFS